MALPPLPESNTARLFVHYIHENTEHEVQIRPQASVTPSGLTAWFNNWLQNNVGLFGNTTTFDSASIAVAGSNIRNPVAWTPVTGVGTPPSDPTRFSRSASFVGRSSDGRKVRVFFYGTIFGPDNTYRVLRSESSNLQQAIDDLNGVSSLIGTISGGRPLFRQYANIRNNGYWQGELRRS